MAIARDTFADLQFDSGSTTQTRSINNVAGTTLYVAVATNDSGQTISGVTWNGVAMTQINSIAEPGARTFYMFYLLNAATGTNDLVVTCSGTAGIFSWFASYTGASNTSQPDAQATNTATSTGSLSQNLTSTEADTWGICIGRSDFDAISGLTNLTGLGSAASLRLLDSNGGLGSAGTETLAFQQTTPPFTGNRLLGIFALIKPAGAPAGPTNLKSLDGNLKANIKSFDGNLIANIKSIDGNS